MKSVVAFVFLSVFVHTIHGELHCTTKPSNVPKEWIDIVSSCTMQVKRQIQEEINASMKYLAMGAHFSKDTVNRLGFAKYFFNSASEERDHAIKLMEYLLMRGELVSGVSDLIKVSFNGTKTHWDSGVQALEDALRTEAYVTKSIRKVIKACEETQEFNDYHLSDYLTGEFLEEQYKGQKEIADKISQLQKLMGKHGKLGEFLFDKKLM